MRVRELLLFAVAAVIGCGDNERPEEGWARVGPLIELPLLEGANHSHEVSVIAAGNHVAVAGMNIQFPSAATFEWGTGPRRVGVWHSSDGGDSFSPADGLGLTGRSSDPVLLAGRPGEFLLGLLNSETGDIVLKRSADGGATWGSVADTLPGFDKPWFAFDAATDNVFLCAANAVAQIDQDGTVLASVATSDTNGISAFVDASGFHCLTIGPTVASWVGGEAAAPLVDAQLDAGDAANVFTRSSGAIGGLADTTWIVRSMRTVAEASLVLELLRSGELTQRQLSRPGEVTFLPAAVMDESGYLHVAWYDTTGPTGVLKYTRTATADLTSQLLDPVVIDDNACPGDRWYPYSSTEDPPGGRRLRASSRVRGSDRGNWKRGTANRSRAGGERCATPR